MPKMAACSGPFQNMRSTMFPNCCVLVPVHMKDNTRLKYPTGNESTNACLRAVIATSCGIRKHLLTSPLSSSVEQAKIKKYFLSPTIFVLSAYFSTSSGTGMSCSVCTNTAASHRIPDPGLAGSL